MKEQLDELAKKLTDEGLLIKAGAIGLPLIFPQLTPIGISYCQKAFMLGAQHLWASVFSVLEKGNEVTPNDLQRMDLIHKELDVFTKECFKSHVR